MKLLRSKFTVGGKPVVTPVMPKKMPKVDFRPVSPEEILAMENARRCPTCGQFKPPARDFWL